MSGVRLDPTSDSCAVMVWCTVAQREALGGSIVDSGIEHSGDDVCYAMVGFAWDSARTDKENYAELDRCWKGCLAEIKAAGLEWEETV